MRNRKGLWLRHFVKAAPVRGVLYWRDAGGDWVRYCELGVVREEAYRRALEHAGYMPRSVELALEADRQWIERGEE